MRAQVQDLQCFSYPTYQLSFGSLLDCILMNDPSILSLNQALQSNILSLIENTDDRKNFEDVLSDVDKLQKLNKQKVETAHGQPSIFSLNYWNKFYQE